MTLSSQWGTTCDRFRNSARTLTLLFVILITGIPAQAARGSSLELGLTRAEAERFWEMAIRAKGGRERLYAVTNVQMSQHEKYLALLRILTINYEGLFVFPNKSWEWDDQRGTVFGFSIHVHNFDRNFHQSYVDRGNGGSVEPLQLPGRSKFERLQLHLFMETKWIQPIPESFRQETLDGHKVDIVQTLVKEFPPDEQKVEFALDRKTHLPVKVIYYWSRKGREFSGGLKLKDYVDVDGIKIPSKIGHVRSKYKLNVEYNPAVFEQPPSRDAGMNAWKNP